MGLFSVVKSAFVALLAALVATLFVTLIAMSLLVSGVAVAQQQEPPQQMIYFPFEPDITTNFIKLEETRHLGYVRVSIEAVVSSPVDLGLIEHHAPLLRSAFLEIFGAAQEGKIRSMTGREELRQECIEAAQTLLEKETGRPIVRDLLFTTYMFQ